MSTRVNSINTTKYQLIINYPNSSASSMVEGRFLLSVSGSNIMENPDSVAKTPKMSEGSGSHTAILKMDKHVIIKGSVAKLCSID